ncbi:MAG: homoserine O-acetyltransferase/O-succinyltransferase family protein [Fibrobacterota bacterium]
MTVIIPDDYPAKQALEERRIQCIQNANAQKQDIRPLRIGILNIMPEAENYEFNLLFPLGRSVLQIQPIWIKLNSHSYKSSSSSHLKRHYLSFDEAVAEKHLDGLIISGAPVEHIPFEEVRYWDELSGIMEYARRNIVSTLGICWGGMALTRHLGIDKKLFDKKMFGVFETRNIAADHPVTGEMDDVYWCPNSRYAGYDDKVLEAAAQKGILNLLAHSKDTGYQIFESADRRFLMHLGHFEYNAYRLVDEYRRDLRRGVRIDAPHNVDLDHPVNRWRTHNLEFFSEWIRYVYQTTEY